MQTLLYSSSIMCLLLHLMPVKSGESNKIETEKIMKQEENDTCSLYKQSQFKFNNMFYFSAFSEDLILT